MSTPGLTIWTFDGPPEHGSDSESPAPSPCDGPKNSTFMTNLERFSWHPTTEKDDDEFYDAPAVPDDLIWTSHDKGKAKALPAGPPTPPVTPPKSTIQKILHGEHYVASFGGTSQHSRFGNSTCGLASLNAIRLAFEIAGKTKDGEELVTKLDAMAIAASWSDQTHLEVESILELPLFSTALQVLDTQHRELRYRTFSDLLVSLKPKKGSAGPRAACLTRCPEIIGIMHVPISRSDDFGFAIKSRHRTDSIYLIFDPHLRPNHPDGAGIQVFPSNSVDQIADYLMDLFQSDEILADDPQLQSQVRLSGQVSYYVLAPTNAYKTLNEYILNMHILMLHQKAAEIKQTLHNEQTQKREVERQIFDLEQEIASLKHDNQTMRDEIKELKTLTESVSSWISNGGTLGWRDNYTNRDVKGKGRDLDEVVAPIALVVQALEPPKLDCSICSDSFADEDIAIVDGCKHSCCRDCMRGVIQSKIEERRYPIPCPFCVVGSDTSNPPGPMRVIQAELVESIGISAELFEIFTEMQLAEHSVLVNCRRCFGSAYVDRIDYGSIEVLACPIAGCTHSWCTKCNQTVEGKMKHSCDGSAELESLMSQHGWKYCPGCRVPVEKIDGCNHLSCKTPGCNV